MNYKIISNQQILEQFIDWLPELESHETFYCCLFARSKYVKGIANLPHIRSDKAQLKRFTAAKHNLLSKIQQLECPLGSYRQKDIEVPQEALALYITINPRNMLIAAQRSTKKLVDLICQPYNGYNPHQEVMSEIQKAKSKSKFVSFDFDLEEKKVETLRSLRATLNSLLNPEAFNIVETRGGCHVIVRTAAVTEEYKARWYHDVASVLHTQSTDNDNKGDIMLPVPGTYQGGFTPYFFK